MIVKKTNSQEYSYLNMLVMGESGSGKTRFLGTNDNEKTLIVNVKSESGMFTLKDKNLDVVDVNSFEEMLQVLRELQKPNKYQYVGVDSFSQLQKNFEKQSKLTDKFKMWAEVKDNTKIIVDEAKLLPIHFVFTCEAYGEKDEEAGAMKYLPLMAGSAKNELPYWFDIILYFHKHQARENEKVQYWARSNSSGKYPCKDRSGKLPQHIENPDWIELNKLIYSK